MPIVTVAGKRIDAIVPFGLPVNTSHQVLVQRGSTNTAPESITLAEAQPAIFTADESGSGQGKIFDINAQLVDASNPAKAGDRVIIWCAGLGAVDPPIVAGEAAPNDPRARTVNAVSITIGELAADVISAALAPGPGGCLFGGSGRSARYHTRQHQAGCGECVRTRERTRYHSDPIGWDIATCAVRGSTWFVSRSLPV